MGKSEWEKCEWTWYIYGKRGARIISREEEPCFEY